MDPKYIQQTWLVHLVAFAQMESLNEDCLQLSELMNKELCSNLTAFVCCFAVLVNGWCACKNYKYKHFRNNEETFMFFGNTRTGTILEPHVCRNLLLCKGKCVEQRCMSREKGSVSWQRETHESRPEFFSHARRQLILLLQYWSCDSTPAL